MLTITDAESTTILPLLGYTWGKDKYLVDVFFPLSVEFRYLPSQTLQYITKLELKTGSYYIQKANEKVSEFSGQAKIALEKELVKKLWLEIGAIQPLGGSYEWENKTLAKKKVTLKPEININFTLRI